MFDEGSPPFVAAVLPKQDGEANHLLLSCSREIIEYLHMKRRLMMADHGTGAGTIRQRVRGKACPFCGGQAYQLVLRATCVSENPTLLIRCHQCHHARCLDQDAQEILWM